MGWRRTQRQAPMSADAFVGLLSVLLQGLRKGLASGATASPATATTISGGAPAPARLEGRRDPESGLSAADPAPVTAGGQPVPSPCQGGCWLAAIGAATLAANGSSAMPGAAPLAGAPGPAPDAQSLMLPALTAPVVAGQPPGVIRVQGQVISLSSGADLPSMSGGSDAPGMRARARGKTRHQYF